MAIPIYNINDDLPCITYPFESRHTRSKKYLGNKALTGYVYGTVNLIAEEDAQVEALHKFWRVDCNYGLEAFIIKIPLFGTTSGDVDYLVQFAADFVSNKTDTVTNISMKLKVLSPVTFVYTDDGYYITDDNGDYIYSDATMHEVTNNVISYTDHPDISEIPFHIDPLVHMDLDTDLSMIFGSGVTFARDTTATYIDSAGLMQTASLNEPRFETNGLLVEGSITNLLLYSEDIAGASWVESNITYTENTEVAPDGTLTANNITKGVVETGGYTKQATIGVDTTEPHTFSIYVKQTGSDFINPSLSVYSATNENRFWATFDLKTKTVSDSGEGGNGVFLNAGLEELANGWFRCTLSGIPNSFTDEGSLFGSRVWLWNSDGIRHALYFEGVATDSLALWGAQLEELPFASSYIPTTDEQVTRGNDDCFIPTDDNVNPDEATYIMYVTLLGLKTLGVNNSKLIDIYDAEFGTSDSTSLKAQHHVQASGNVSMQDDVDLNFGSYQAIEVGTKTKIALTQDGTTNSIYIKGSLDRDRLTDFWRPTAGSYIHLGGAYSVQKNYLFGHVSNFSIYGKALTANEMSSL